MAKEQKSNDVKADNASDVKLENLKKDETVEDQGTAGNIEDQKNPPPALKDQAETAANKGGGAVTKQEEIDADNTVTDPETGKIVYTTAEAYQRSLSK